MPGKPVNLATISGAPTHTVTLGGQDYRVGTLRPRDVADLQAFLMRTTPNPKIEARKLIEGLPEGIAIAIWDREMAAAPPWPPTLDGPQGRAAMVSPDGMAETVFVILRHTVAGLTREQANEIADAIDMGEFQALIEAVMPESAAEAADEADRNGDGDPKVGGAVMIHPTSRPAIS